MTDGGTVELEEERLYRIVRRAVGDAIRAALGTLVLLGFALVLISLGARIALATAEPAGVAFGGFLVVLALVFAASVLDLV